LLALLIGGAAAACDDDPVAPEPLDPDSAPRVAVDRFSPQAATLFERTPANGLPAPNAPIDFDQGPFITHGLGPDGESVSYYNFDVQRDAPAPIFVFFREGESVPVQGQLNVIDVLPGDPAHSDFWQIIRVIVPRDYVANTVTSLQAIMASGYRTEPTDVIVNCPVVPDGSVARLRVTGSSELMEGWYRDQVVSYFSFEERALTSGPQGRVPTSPIFVAFNINPGEPGGGPPSGFRTEPGTEQTHNVVATLPADAAYSPLWNVVAYHNEDFPGVSDLATAQVSRIVEPSLGLVNCPIARID
jgi:hypothetical protein